ncbi:MAG: hypothetical protein SFU87_08215 [Chitinophagaceae bacterium]|nr:hypothetical protein [Chitinophagaceae bacterium]
MKKIKRTYFIPDKTYETHFPWEDVKACFKKKLESSDFNDHNRCPKCGLDSKNLFWINFSSPSWTWENLCGRSGPLSICPNCKIQVEFILTEMN